MTLGEILETSLIDTLLGMGTVFIILMIIAAIIKGFSYIPFLKDPETGGEEGAAGVKKAAGGSGAGSKAAEVSEGPGIDETDQQIAAVIMAAIQAYMQEEENAGDDQYIVRSIRRSTWKHTLSE